MARIPSPAQGLTPEHPLPEDCAKRFAVERHLADGGFGSVYLARDGHLGRQVAVKVLHKDVLVDEEQVRRFTDEGRITAAIAHPGVVQVVDSGAAFGIPWIAYEYVPGRSLRQILDSGGMPIDAAIDAALQVADALEAAHACGVLHRDIKPDNVLEEASGRFKVTDFGIAKWTASSVKTRTGVILGTPAYLSPEQICGEAASPSSDVYALGVMLFELATNELPFQEENPVLLLERHLKSPAPKPSALRPGLPRALDDVVQKALAKSPEARYPSALAMRQELETALSGPGGQRALRTASVSRHERALRTTVRPRVVAARAPDAPAGSRLARWAVASVAVLAASVLALFHHGGRPELPAAGSPLTPSPATASPGRSSPAAVPTTSMLRSVNDLALTVVNLENRFQRAIGAWRTLRSKQVVPDPKIRQDCQVQRQYIQEELGGRIPDEPGLKAAFEAAVEKLRTCGERVLQEEVPWYVERSLSANAYRLLEVGTALQKEDGLSTVDPLIMKWRLQYGSRFSVHEMASGRYRMQNRPDDARREWLATVQALEESLKRRRGARGRDVKITDLLAPPCSIEVVVSRTADGSDVYGHQLETVLELTILMDLYSELFRRYQAVGGLATIASHLAVVDTVLSELTPEQRAFYQSRPAWLGTQAMIRWLDTHRGQIRAK